MLQLQLARKDLENLNQNLAEFGRVNMIFCTRNLLSLLPVKRWRFVPTPASLGSHTANWPRVLMLLLLTTLFAPIQAQAQCSKTVKLEPGTNVQFKLKPKRDLNSSKLRIGDYVEFELLDDLKWKPECGDEKQTIISKGTPVLGQVLDRHHRFTIFKKASFGVGKLKTNTIDGERIALEIRRPPREVKEEDKRSDEKAEARGCVDKTVARNARSKSEPCIKGRVYAAKFLSSLPSALLSVAAATTLVRVKDDAEAAVVGVTLVEKIASQTGLSDILNGVDAEMNAGEIFDANLVLGDSARVIKLPAGETKKDEQKVGRYTGIPTPPEFVVTDYFSDLSAYPAPPGVFYNGQVIERHTDKMAGAKMNICVGQSLPSGWVELDRKKDPKVCSRESNDNTDGPTYIVILKS